MKKNRIVLPLATITLTLSALALGTPTLAAGALSPCKQACLDQHQGNVETLLHTPPAANETDRLGRRQIVLNAIDALNNCVQACDLAPAPAPTPEPTPAPAPEPTPAPGGNKRR